MSSIIENLEPEEIAGSSSSSPAPKRKFDAGFLRNMKILVVVLIVAIALIAFLIWRSSEAISNSGRKADAMGIPSAVVEGSKAIDPTPSDVARINRVAAEKSEAAANAGESFVPTNMPLLAAPLVVEQPPGTSYSASTGQRGNEPRARDTADVKRGLDRLVNQIVDGLEAPGTQTADPYKTEVAGKDVPGKPAAAAAVAAVAAKSIPPLVGSLQIAAASLEAAIDTENTDFVMVRVATGPAAGALVTGQAVVQGNGVRVVLNKMSLNGKPFAINAIALDAATSSNAMSAQIDRQLLTRYVLPIFAATAQAYFQAIAQPGQTTVSDGLAASSVVTPAATVRQASASGIAAGIGQAAKAIQPTGGPTAFIPQGTSIGILFIDPVVEVKQ